MESLMIVYRHFLAPIGLVLQYDLLYPLVIDFVFFYKLLKPNNGILQPFVHLLDTHRATISLYLLDNHIGRGSVVVHTLFVGSSVHFPLIDLFLNSFDLLLDLVPFVPHVVQVLVQVIPYRQHLLHLDHLVVHVMQLLLHSFYLFHYLLSFLLVVLLLLLLVRIWLFLSIAIAWTVWTSVGQEALYQLVRGEESILALNGVVLSFDICLSGILDHSVLLKENLVVILRS